MVFHGDSVSGDDTKQPLPDHFPEITSETLVQFSAGICLAAGAQWVYNHARLLARSDGGAFELAWKKIWLVQKKR